MKKFKSYISNYFEKENYKFSEITVFLSIGNEKKRALVLHETGSSLDTLLDTLFLEAEKLGLNLKWAKIDVAVNITKEKYENIKNYLAKSESYSFRKGISFSKDFGNSKSKHAFLEEELNNYKIFNYSKSEINKEYLSNYLSKYYDTYPTISEDVYLFDTISFFTDGKDIFKLHDTDIHKGARIIEPTLEYIEHTSINAANWLLENVNDDGKFNYGYLPMFDKPIESYNIVRHVGTIWSLLILYKLTKNSSIVRKIERAINYAKTQMVYEESDVCYLVEEKSKEIKLGASGIAVLMFTAYMEVFETDVYVDIVRHFANGILKLQEEDGSFYHVLNSTDFSKKEKFRTIYYDGECGFGLVRAYTFTKDEKFLNAAKKAVDFFIQNNYTKHRDHWISYTMNEITKYIHDEKYFIFAMNNFYDNRDRLVYKGISSCVLVELIMASFETYLRYLELGLKIDYIENLNIADFANTAYRRMHMLLNTVYTPEFAMYTKKPSRFLDSFFVRGGNFRVRIDDIQHCIGGLYMYISSYETLESLITEKNIGFLKENTIKVNNLEVRPGGLVDVGYVRGSGKPSMDSYITAMAMVALNFGIRLLAIDSLSNFDIQNNNVKCYIFKNAKWERDVVPIPPLVDVLPARIKKNTKVDLKKVTKLVSRASFGGKDKIYDLILKDGTFSDMIIPTIKDSGSFNDFKNVLYESKNKSIISKPNRGKKGIDVFKISEREGFFEITHGLYTNKLDLGEFEDFYNENIKNNDHIIQQFINSTSPNGSPFDIRIHCIQQKSVHDFGFYAFCRVGNRRGVTSNVSQGGYVSNLEDFLYSNYPKDISDNIIGAVTNLGNTFPKYLIKLMGGRDTQDLSLDLGLEVDGDKFNLYLFEVNSSLGITGQKLDITIPILICRYYRYKLGIKGESK